MTTDRGNLEQSAVVMWCIEPDLSVSLLATLGRDG